MRRSPLLAGCATAHAPKTCAHVRRWSPLIVAVALLGCQVPSSGADGGVDAGGGITPVELCDRLAAARCGLESRCFTAFAKGTAADCRAAEQASCLAKYEVLKAHFVEGKVGVDSAQLASCESRMASSTCPPSFPPNYPAVTARAFDDCDLESGILVGTTESGTCAFTVECRPGKVCSRQDGVCLGVCTSWPAVGEYCAFGCAPGLYCDSQGTCRGPGDVGAVCANSTECKPNLICTGTCGPPARAGEACRYDPARLSTCEAGLACDLTPFVSGQVGTCIAPRAEGGRCKFHWSCASGLVCAGLDWTGFPQAAPAQDGYCRAPSVEGAGCSFTPYALYLGDPCVGGTVCDGATGKCTLAPQLGQTCAPSQQDCGGVSVYCRPAATGDVGSCSGASSIGERCAYSVDATHTVTVPCRTGFCDAAGAQTCRAPNKADGTVCATDGECSSNHCALQSDGAYKCRSAC